MARPLSPALRRAIAVPLAALTPVVVRAQTRPARPDSSATDTLRAALDSMAARLERAEAAIAVLREQVATESQSTVHTRSRIALDVSARIMTNVAYTRGQTNDPGLPTVAQQSTEYAHVLGLSLRQSRVGAAVTVHDVAGGTFDGDIDLDFFGGGRDANGNRPLFPEPRLRTARATMRWRQTSVMIGSDSPLISDLDPMSLASVGVTEFSGAGDLWNWLPQVRVRRALVPNGPLRFAAQAAVMEPFTSATYDPVRPGGGDAGERSGKPFVEGRLSARWGPEDETPGLDVRDAIVGEGPSEIGFGVHHGWVTVDEAHRYTSRALSMDWRIVVAPRVELRGEAYTGRLLLGLGGGAIGQNFGRPATTGGTTPTVGTPLRDRAVWTQLNVRPSERVMAGVGCGVDRVNDDDRPDRRQNTACAAHVRWSPMQPLLLGVEYRRLSTLYSTGMYHANHFNFTFGFDL